MHCIENIALLIRNNRVNRDYKRPQMWIDGVKYADFRINI